MSAEVLLALEELEKEKGIDKEVIISAIEAALNASYGKSETETNTRVEFNRETGEIKVYAQKEVVEVVENDTAELSLEEASGWRRWLRYDLSPLGRQQRCRNGQLHRGRVSEYWRRSNSRGRLHP